MTDEERDPFDAELEELRGSKAALQTEIERLRKLNDDLQEESQHRLEMLQRQKAHIDRTERRECEYLALIEKRTAERDVWAEQVTQLKAERHTTKMMLHDILDKHIPKKPVD